jgi:hypothetical protein
VFNAFVIGDEGGDGFKGMLGGVRYIGQKAACKVANESK